MLIWSHAIELVCAAVLAAAGAWALRPLLGRLWPDWHLRDVEAAHRAHPVSFSIPPRTERVALGAGQIVRLCFCAAEREERLWVRVAGAGYVGTLLTGSQVAQLEPGARVRFGPEHVAQVLVARGDPRWVDCAKLVLVSAAVLGGQEPPCWLYRTAPLDERESGWRVLGASDDPHRGPPRHLVVTTLGELLAVDGSAYILLNHPVGSAFRRGTPGPGFAPMSDGSVWEQLDRARVDADRAA